MRLVDDDRVVAREVRVGLDLGQEDAVGHELDEGAGRGLLGEAHLVSDDPAQLDAELVAQALGDRAGGQAARLGVPDHAGHSAAQFQADLRQLRGLARTRLPRDDDDLVVAYGRRDVLPSRRDGKVGVVDGGHGCAPCRLVAERSGGSVPVGGSRGGGRRSGPGGPAAASATASTAPAAAVGAGFLGHRLPLSHAGGFTRRPRPAGSQGGRGARPRTSRRRPVWAAER